MAKSYDINHAPPGGYTYGGWYWDPQAGNARQWNGQSFGAPGQVFVGSNAAQPEANVNPLQQVNNSIQDSFKRLQDEVVKKFGDYQSSKPFNIDEVLAAKTTEAHEQIDPYYDQLVGDYLLGVQRKIDRGVNDTKDLLTELSASTSSYDEGTTNAITKATQDAEQGYADAGLLGSGDQLRKGGEITQAGNANLTDYNRKAGVQANQLTTANGRNIEDVNLAKKSYLSDVGRSQYTDVANRASQLTKEAGQQYVQGFQAALPGELQSANGFDMLKSLGIYS